MAKSWLEGAEPIDGGFRVPGQPEGHAATLAVTPDGVAVKVGNVGDFLAWRDHVGPLTVVHSAADVWGITSYFVRFRPVGIAVEGSGRCAAVLDGARRATRTARNRWLTRGAPARAVPLASRITASRPVDQERATLTALCAFLATTASARERLRDPARVAKLVADLPQHAVPAKIEPQAVRRLAVEVLAALHSLGFVHRLRGRPIGGEPVHDPTDVVEQVARFVAANPHAHDLAIDETAIRDYVHRYYLDVEPWPFDALTLP